MYAGTGVSRGRYRHGQVFRRKPMDLHTVMSPIDAPQPTREDEIAYAAGWTISGLATLGTIVAVWLLAL
jgi:hypothetical protein